MKYTYIILLSCLPIILFNSCHNQKTDLIEENIENPDSGISVLKSQFESSNYKLGEVEQHTFSKIVNTTGTLQIPDKSKAAISTLINGTVGIVNLMEGQWVNKNQKLFSVTNPELINLQEEYLVAAGQLEYLREEYNRQVELNNENLTTKKDLLKAKSDLSTTQARYGAMNKKLNLYGVNTNELTTDNLVSSLAVRSPISGYISNIDVLQGSYIEPNQAALTIVNSSDMYLELSVLEKDAAQLKKGQNLKFSLQGDAAEYEATIYLINESIDENHMIKVICKINSDKKDLIPGMYANAQVVLDEYTGIALPESAIVKASDEHLILQLTEENSESFNFEKKTIKIGSKNDGYVEILTPLNRDTKYLVNGAYYLTQ